MKKLKNKEKAHKYRIGIVGIGMVGDMLRRYFESKGYTRGETLFCFDADSKKNFRDKIEKAEIIFVCVPTPPTVDGSCDISIVENVVKKYANVKNVIVIKSTVVPGTAEMLAKKYNAKILFNPEFLTESRAWEDMIKPDRQIVGYTANTKEYTREILNLLPTAYFSSPGALDSYNRDGLNATEAEVGKYASNVFGALKVTFGNILADYCNALENTLENKKSAVEVDYNKVRYVLANDSRIGDSWLEINRGDYRGYGGYCFPKDSNAFIASAKKILHSLDKSSPTYKILQKGIALFEAMRDYNTTLLESQGLSVASVSVHDAKLKIKKS